MRLPGIVSRALGVGGVVRALPFGRVALWTSIAAWATAMLGLALGELLT